MAGEPLRITVVCHGGLEDDLDIVDEYYLRLRGRLEAAAGGQPAGTHVDIHFQGIWAKHFSALQPNDLFFVQNSFQAPLADGGGPIWMVTTGGATVLVARGGIGIFTEIEANLQRLDWDSPDWFRLPSSTRPTQGQHDYWRISSLQPRRETNVFAVMWENARPGVVLNTHGGTSSYCRNLLLVDESMINQPCSTWTTDPVLPECSLQVKLSIGPGRLRSLPYLCMGAVVRAHRVETMRKSPKYLNLWYRKYSSIAVFDDHAEQQAVPPADLCTLRAVDQAHVPTVSDSDRLVVWKLSRWIRGHLQRETISAYLRTLADVPTQNDSDDLVVEVLATHPPRKEFLATDWSSGTRPVRIRCVEPDLGPSYSSTNTSTWLLGNMQPGHWVKLRDVRTQPHAYAWTYVDPGGVQPDLYVQASMVTRVPQWCLDAVVRANDRTDDRSNDFETDVGAFRSLPPPDNNRRASLPALPAPPADDRPAAAAEDGEVVAGGRAVLHLPADRAADLHYAGSVVTVLEVDDIGNKVRVRLEEGDVWVSKDAVQMVSQARSDEPELRLHPNRRGRLMTSYGGEAHLISAALHPEAESNLLLKSFTVLGVCGFQGGSTFLTSLNVKELLCAV